MVSQRRRLGPREEPDKVRKALAIARAENRNDIRRERQLADREAFRFTITASCGMSARVPSRSRTPSNRMLEQREEQQPTMHSNTYFGVADEWHLVLPQAAE